MLFIDRDFVHQKLTYDVCIPLMRDAMMQFSSGETRQLLRSIMPLGEGRLFGAMLGGLVETEVFGAKLVSVFPHNATSREFSHQGVVVLFNAAQGNPVCIVDAGSVTAIRTASASAAATHSMASREASCLALLGCGEQAVAHALAILEVREIKEIIVWGRSEERANVCAKKIQKMTGVNTRYVPNAHYAVEPAQIVCTVTSSPDPILKGEWIAPGTHVNLVGSSHLGTVEADTELVRISRFVVDSRESVMAQGSEYLRAIKAGAVSENHIVGEIGEVFAGKLDARASSEDITVYKSLGHIVQDLAAAAYVYNSRLEKDSFDKEVYK